MEHQSFNRGELLPEDVKQYQVELPDLLPDLSPTMHNIASRAIDAVRSCGWYEGTNNTP